MFSRTSCPGGGAEPLHEELVRRLTSHCSPRQCSATLPAMFNLGDEDAPLWFSVDASGIPSYGAPPKQLESKPL